MAQAKNQRLSLRLYRDRLTREGKTSFGHHFTVVSSPSFDHLIYPRFAILVSKKTASLANDRNRLKRITSSLLQALTPQISSGDFLIIPKRQVLTTAHQVLLDDLKMLFL